MALDSTRGSVDGGRIVKAVTKGTFICLFILIGIFYYLCSQMGLKNMFGTIMATAFDLLLNTSFFIMAVAVLAGAFSGLMSEFGIIALINTVLSPLMRPLYRLPGAAALGVVTTFLSDNPAIVALARDRDFIKYFTYRQRALLTNLGTAFGMGLIVATVQLALSDSSEMVYAVCIGVGAATLGSVISVRLMDFFVRRHYGDKGDKLVDCGMGEESGGYDMMRYRKIRDATRFERLA